MTRRRIDDEWKTGLVAEATIAPHRYTWLDHDDSYRSAATYREFRDGCPYQPGDVVLIERMGNGFYYAAKARVIGVFIEYNERLGERQEKYRVQYETKAGTWSKLWEYAFPGYIQRGYLCAGYEPSAPYEHGLSAITELAKFIGKLCKYSNYLACLTANDELGAHYRDMKTFAAYVQRWFPGAKVQFAVNGCAYGWAPGTKADFTAYIGIPGVLSYNGGGKTVAGSLASARHYIDEFIGERLARLVLSLNGQDPNGFNAFFHRSPAPEHWA